MKIFLFVALCCGLICLGQAEDPTTIQVAVMEGSPTNVTDKDKSLIQTNFDHYWTFVKNSIPQILVLPEFGLTGRTDDKTLAIKSTEITDDNKDLKYINNIAKTNNITIVVSLLEQDDDDLYSTTLVLYGGDQPLAKYRKINLNETEKKLTSANDVVTFKHLGMVVGLLSGDDILYDEPANKLVKDSNATLIIYTSSMASVAPFKTTVSLHAAFAKTHGVNLLVASLHDPDHAVSGSGIFTPCIIKSDITAQKGYNNLLSVKIDAQPAADCKGSMKDVLLYGTKLQATDAPLSQLPIYNYDGLKTQSVNQSATDGQVCDGSFCCNYTITVTEWKDNEFYRMAANDDQKVCGLMFCTDKDKIDSCGKIDQVASTTFSKIVIKTTDGDGSFLPYILHSDMTPQSDLTNAQFLEDGEGANITVTTITDAIVVGIVSTKSGASSLEVFITTLVAMFFLLKQF